MLTVHTSQILPYSSHRPNALKVFTISRNNNSVLWTHRAIASDTDSLMCKNPNFKTHILPQTSRSLPWRSHPLPWRSRHLTWRSHPLPSAMETLRPRPCMINTSRPLPWRLHAFCHEDFTPFAIKTSRPIPCPKISDLTNGWVFWHQTCRGHIT